MKHITYILLFSILIVSCQRNKGDTEASNLLSKAREYTEEGSYEHAKELIDSLNNIYPFAYTQKAYGERLLDTICHRQSALLVDSLTNLQYEYKIRIYESALSNQDINILQAKIDSLEIAKEPYRKVIKDIYNKEAKIAASNQCKTIMRNK